MNDCPRCGSANTVPNGRHNTVPAVHCRTCGCTTTTVVLAVTEPNHALHEGA